MQAGRQVGTWAGSVEAHCPVCGVTVRSGAGVAACRCLLRWSAQLQSYRGEKENK